MSAYVLSNGQRVYPAFVLNDADGGGIVTAPASFRLSTGEQVLGIVLVDENGEIAAAPGAQQLDIVEPLPAFDASTQQTTVAQTVYMGLVRVARPVTVTKLSAYTTATGTNFDFAILDASGAKLVGLSAPVASVANGLTTGTLTTAFTYEPGQTYYNATVPDAATTGIRGMTGVNAIVNAGGIVRSASKAVAQNTIPATVSSPTAVANCFWIAGHN